MADVDYAGSYGLVATRGGEDRLVGHGAYVSSAPDRAEVAFAIADEMQGQGLGTILLAHLAEVAQDNDVSVFVAEVMPRNHRMIEVFRESGFPVELSSLPGTIEVELPTSFSAAAVERFEERDRLAAQAAVRRFMKPRAIAVVGASGGGGRSAARSSTTSCSPISAGSSIRSTRPPTWSRRFARTRPSPRSPARSTWR